MNTSNITNKNNKMKLIYFVVTISVISIFVNGCNTLEEKSAERDFFAMDTYMQIVCYGKDAEKAANEAEEEVKRLESIFDANREDSEVAKLNRLKTLNTNSDMISIVNKSIDMYKSTDGAFDITVKPLIDLWGFSTGILNVPAKSEIEEKVKKCTVSTVNVDSEKNTITIGDEQMIDLGGVAKGYATDRIKDIFEKYNLTGAYISLGGNVYCYRTKTDGTLWKIGIRNPKEADLQDSAENCFAAVSVGDKAVITSGGYERYLTDEKTGKKYIHIIDPKTGAPSESDILSATIISDDATLADGLSTACFIMGSDDAADYWRQHKDEFDMILYTENDEVIVTDGLKENIKCDLYKVQVID